MSSSSLIQKPLKYLPYPINIENYSQLLGFNSSQSIWPQFESAMLNSIISATGTTLIVIVIAILAGYAFGRLEFVGKNIIFVSVLVTMALPAYAVMIPLYKIIISLHLIDTQTGIILIYTSAFAPLAVWLMRSFFMTIPKDLEESAMVDGASRFRALCTILPMAAPGLIAVALLTFLNSWSQFAIPLVFAPTNAKPLTILITEFQGKSFINYGLMTAAGIVTIIPPILIVLFLNRYLISGLTAGSVKG
ncbi:carbohydrate ABC transporter permease [Sporolactobacillus shoreae]|uniref:Carbohydrate ABC transporter permease n=2 Tax=Sporolactobacillus shoreae TaxID=1465501 RepID=A0A4Z0GMT0_9BACL|nr:carbohydrate ABC transporter permease [Sporolactobacillus shoreae]